ncbi:hypothetical protein CORC01_07966, partial [Colletotrichum orchidophilum]
KGVRARRQQAAPPRARHPSPRRKDSTASRLPLHTMAEPRTCLWELSQGTPNVQPAPRSLNQVG